jgi:alcohol dehydrogenase class IV
MLRAYEKLLTSGDRAAVDAVPSRSCRNARSQPEKEGNEVKIFTYDALPGRVIFEPGASRRRLAEEVDRMGVSRVLLIATERERKLVEELSVPLGKGIVGVFTNVKSHVPVEVAEEARELARRLKADCLLSIGGGATTGTAKAIALAEPLPIVAVPTTYAGSEMTPVWGLTAGKRKTTGSSRDVLPKVVIYDPELTFSLPRFITGPSAMNAMAHCVEAFYAPKANPITSLMAEEGMRALAHGVPVAVEKPEDLEGRSAVLYGAYLAGAALAAAGSGLHHKICHVLGGAYNLPHAEMHTIILPHVVAFNEPAIPAIMGQMARAIGVQSAAAGLYDLAKRIGAPTALKNIGMQEENLNEGITLIMEKAPKDNPRPVDEAGIRAILEDAYTGHRPESMPERSL